MPGTSWVFSQYGQKILLRKRFGYIKSITEGSGVNFPISKLRNYETENFGDNVKRLERVNRKYDPFHVFRFPQGLR
ncbi:BBE domain-containing protein [Bacillus sp. NTK074B]|uniref:BBE domain-containing protein n=1 Tax=Bacillus sp. NTK074B TaxID=2802174 RepID=UPI001FD24B7C